MAQLHADKINVAKMDIDSSPVTPTKFDVRSIPTLLLFYKGKVIGQLVGAVPKTKIEQLIKDKLAEHGVPA